MTSFPPSQTMMNASQPLASTPSPPPWTFSEAASPSFWCFALTFTSLLIATFPHRISHFAAISLVLLTGWGALQTGNNIFPDTVFVDYYLRFVIILVSHVMWLVYSGTLKRSASLDGRKGKVWMRGYKRLFNSRGIGEVWELPDLWPSQASQSTLKEKSKSEEQKEKSAPRKSKLSAILSHTGHIIINFTILCIYYEFLTPSSIPSTSYPLLHRPLLALSNFLPDYLILSTYHSFFALIFISLSIDTPGEWPPLFGSLSAAYTVRGFWGKFWHRLVYRSFTGHARVILRAVGVDTKGQVGRLLGNVMVFLLSGLMHGAVPWMMGTKCAWRAGMEYCMMQPVAFVLEGIVAAHWRKVREEILGWVADDKLDVFERCVGYVWVVSWLVWEAPRRNGAVLRRYAVQR